MRIAIDANSKLKTCLAAGTDPEYLSIEFEGSEVKVNTAAYGYENLVNSLVKLMQDTSTKPKDLIFVWDGVDGNAKRLSIDPTYKAKRSRKPPEYYVQYQALRDKVMQIFLDLGSISVTQDKLEADDMLAYLALNTEEDMIIDTNDGDMTVLNIERNEYGAQVQVRINGVIGENKYGSFPHKLVTLYKALVGDTSDGIKGCKGFGDAAWLSLFAKYDVDGVEEIFDVVSKNKIDSLHDLTTDPAIKKIWEQGEQVYKSYRLARLYPEWVNTLLYPWQWTAGMCKPGCEDERLRRLAQQTRLVTDANYQQAFDFLKQQLAVTPEPAFDIETSTPDESDDWLEAQGDAFGVDVMGSVLTGFSITFGSNNQFTYYVSVDHRDTANIAMVQARQMIELLAACDHTVIQNTAFENTIFLNTADEDGTLWRDIWKDNGYSGCIPKWLDTVFEASYVNENIPLGLKFRSKEHLRYDQTTYEEVTNKTGTLSELPAGGRVKKFLADDVVVKQYKMRELTAQEVFSYGCDDTICTAALHNFYKLFMQLEHTYKVYQEVEIDASYLHAWSFVQGASISLEKMNELAAIDDETYNKAWTILRGYLISHGWDGTIPPVYTKEITAKGIKEAYAITSGIDEAEDEEDSEEETSAPTKDAFLSTRIRTPSKMVALLRSLGHETFADRLQACLDGKHVEFTEWVQSKFTGEPKFKISNKQMQKLLYEVMQLPVRVANKPTDKMRAEGKTTGTPKTDALAIAYGLQDASEEVKPVLEAVKLVQMVKTRRSLYYSKYPGFLHWKTGKIHSTHRQCSTNTRRAASAKPNTQQLPKAEKIVGEPARFREVIVPHKKNAVIVSLDFEQQELKVIADYSQDPVLLSCYVGNNKKDMHALTGLGIAKEKYVQCKDWTYELFMEALNNGENVLHDIAKTCRKLGKLTNFATEFGAMAPKLATTLLVTEEDAQLFIDAREATFARVKEWKEEVIAEAKVKGFVKTMLGAVRHLAPAFTSGDRWEASKAERQAVNFKVQSSSAEMTKIAEGRIWAKGIMQKYDCTYIGPVHDETVFSVSKEDLVPFLLEVHPLVAQQYAGMAVPVTSSFSFGPDFGRQWEGGNTPTRKIIETGLLTLS